jgi:hypothetical protein
MKVKRWRRAWESGVDDGWSDEAATGSFHVGLLRALKAAQQVWREKNLFPDRFGASPEGARDGSRAVKSD